MAITAEKLKALRQEMPYKWKVQSARAYGCECVAYVDARQVMELLDEVIGPENWQDQYYEVTGKVYCTLSIKVGEKWIAKSDCGTPSAFEADKGQASDAFKRAAVKWGIGRYLYAMPMIKTKSIEIGKDKNGYPKFAPADEQGQRIYNLSGYIHNLQSRKKENRNDAKRPLAAAPVAVSIETQKQELKVLCDTLGWNGEQLNIWLKENLGASWKTMTTNQAQKAIEGLASILEAQSAI